MGQGWLIRNDAPFLAPITVHYEGSTALHAVIQGPKHLPGVALPSSKILGPLLIPCIQPAGEGGTNKQGRAGDFQGCSLSSNFLRATCPHLCVRGLGNAVQKHVKDEGNMDSGEEVTRFCLNGLWSDKIKCLSFTRPCLRCLLPPSVLLLLLFFLFKFISCSSVFLPPSSSPFFSDLCMVDLVCSLVIMPSRNC